MFICFVYILFVYSFCRLLSVCLFCRVFLFICFIDFNTVLIRTLVNL